MIEDLTDLMLRLFILGCMIIVLVITACGAAAFLRLLFWILR